MVRIRWLQHIRMAAEPFRVNSKVTATEPPRRTGKPGRSSSSPTVRGSTKPRVGCNASIHPAAPRSPHPRACFQRRTLPLADCTTQMRRGDILRGKKKKKAIRGCWARGKKRDTTQQLDSEGFSGLGQSPGPIWLYSCHGEWSSLTLRSALPPG